MHARAVVIVCVWRQQEKKGERRQGKKDGADKAAFAPSARCGARKGAQRRSGAQKGGGERSGARASHGDTRDGARVRVWVQNARAGEQRSSGGLPVRALPPKAKHARAPPPPNKQQPTEAPKIVCVCACVLRVVAPRAQEWVLFNHHAGARRRVVVCVSKEARNGSRELRWLGWWLGTQPSQCVVRRVAERGDKQRVCKRPPPRPACALVQRARRWWLRQVAQVAWGKYMIVCFGCVCV